jgi:hypothetical protein
VTHGRGEPCPSTKGRSASDSGSGAIVSCRPSSRPAASARARRRATSLLCARAHASSPRG